MPKYLSASEVAELLGVSLKWLYQRKREIPGYFRLGGINFWDEEILKNTLKQMAQNTAKAKSPGSKGRHGL